MNEKYAQYLMEQGNKMLSLANRLGIRGDRLEKEDKQLVRMASLPALKEMQMELAMLFVQGADCGTSSVMTEMLEVMADLRD